MKIGPVKPGEPVQQVYFTPGMDMEARFYPLTELKQIVQFIEQFNAANVTTKEVGA